MYEFAFKICLKLPIDKRETNIIMQLKIFTTISNIIYTTYIRARVRAQTQIGDYIFLIHTKRKLACEYFLYICMGFIFNDNTMF